jgi:hypothetical protein
MSKVVNTSSNLIPPDEDVSQYSQAEINTRVLGSKLVLLVEQMQIATIWLVKACLLIMYFRMTAVLPQRKLVIATSIYVAVTFVGLPFQLSTPVSNQNLGCHGDPLLWCMVPSIQPVLCCATKLK